MTEVEWLESTEPERMLEALAGQASDRKLRLFASALYRTILPLLPDDPCREAVEVLERHADGGATAHERGRSGRGARTAYFEIECSARDEKSRDRSFAVLILYRLLVASSASYAGINAYHATRTIERIEATGFDPQFRPFSGEKGGSLLVREVFGNPFRPITFSPNWRTPPTLALARCMYEDRSFEAMPLLADALEEAGCTDEQILSHCRGPGPHVRGCWVLDLLLQKS